MSKTDTQLKQDVEAELRWDPSLNAAQIGVTVDRGAVSLFGAVDTYPQRWAAEKAARRVSGVRTLAQDLTVKLLTEHKRSDTEIAAAMLSAFQWDVAVPSTVTARVERGAVTLLGQVAWNYQREAAEHAVHALAGVVSVFNDISLEPKVSTGQMKAKLETALERHAMADAKSIHIEAVGSKVTLTGKAKSWSSLDDAVAVAWATPGVTQVINEVSVSPMF